MSDNMKSKYEKYEKLGKGYVADIKILEDGQGFKLQYTVWEKGDVREHNEEYFEDFEEAKKKAVNIIRSLKRKYSSKGWF